MAVILSGDWERVSNVLNSLSTNLGENVQQALEETANEALTTIQGHIDSQDLGWSPLSSSTIKAKGHDNIYVETGELRNSFQVQQVSSGETTSFRVGIPSGTQHSSGLPTSKVMEYMEYGTTKQPPRPLIRPSMQEVKPKFLRIVGGAIKDLVRG